MITTMITEDYVSFETAKLLKEKGFDEPCHYFYEYNKRLYNDMGKYFPDGMKNSDHDKEGNKGVSAPSLQMAMKWLRKKYRLFIAVVPFSKIDGCFYYSHTIIHLHNSKCDTEYKSDGFNSPEKAIKDALQYCLTNLI